MAEFLCGFMIILGSISLWVFWYAALKRFWDVLIAGLVAAIVCFFSSYMFYLDTNPQQEQAQTMPAPINKHTIALNAKGYTIREALERWGYSVKWWHSSKNNPARDALLTDLINGLPSRVE